VNVLAYVHLRNIHRSTGAGRVARQLTENVAVRDHVNMHILADEADHDAIVPKVGKPWTTFPYHLFSSDTSKQQARWLLTHRPKAEDFWPHAQIVHCTGESYVPTSRSRLVVTVHDAACFERTAHRQNLSAIKHQLKWRLLFATLSRTADLFHTVSQFSADRLATFFPSMANRLRVIHNAVPERFFAPVNSIGEEFMAHTRLAGKRYVLVPGGLHYRKNADLILRAWPILRARVSDLSLVVSGHCDPELATRAQGLNSVHLAGFVDDDELCALYHGAQAVWFPTRYEGFGLPVVEAMACGTPVVASNSSSIPEIAGKDAILVNPNSLDENVDALLSVLNDSGLREHLAAQGRRRAARFTWPLAAAQLHELYSSLV
jgi:glycosyltransferase involved in cell wall biosynthesis